MLSEIRAKLRTKRGFTLMEILIVIAIIAVLSVAFLPNALSAPKKARDVVRIKKVQDIQTAVEAYAAEQGSPPASADDSCFDDVTAALVVIAPPKDASSLNSCGVAGKEDLYLYHYNSTARVYVIGVKLEVTSAANSLAAITTKALVIAEITNDSTVASARTALIKVGKADTSAPYFLAVGPV